MARRELARFLRQRREDLRPTDIGLPAGQRRRTRGLRRQEVAQLAHMSVAANPGGPHRRAAVVTG
jgi:hypothetical protein